MQASAVLLSFFGAPLISGVCFAYFVVSKLSESAWIGSQAFNRAKAFNRNIGAWNTARIANMESVCALCDCLHERRVPWLGVRHCVVDMPSATADRAHGRACLLVCFTHLRSMISTSENT